MPIQPSKDFSKLVSTHMSIPVVISPVKLLRSETGTNTYQVVRVELLLCTPRQEL